MRFGRTLERHADHVSKIDRGKFIAYTAMKQAIRQRVEQHRSRDVLETARFKRNLRRQLATVNAFYVRTEDALLNARNADSLEHTSRVIDLKQVGARSGGSIPCPSQLTPSRRRRHAQYAVLNYVGFLKLVKKHDRHCGTAFLPVIEKVLRYQPFVHALLNSPLFYITPQKRKELGWPVSHCDEPCGICLEQCTHVERLVCGHEFCMPCLAKASARDMNACPLCREPQSLHPIDVALIQFNIDLKYSPIVAKHRRTHEDDEEKAEPKGAGAREHRADSGSGENKAVGAVGGPPRRRTEATGLAATPIPEEEERGEEEGCDAKLDGDEEARELDAARSPAPGPHVVGGVLVFVTVLLSVVLAVAAQKGVAVTVFCHLAIGASDIHRHLV